MKNIKPMLIGASSGILVIVLYMIAMHFYNESSYKKFLRQQEGVNFYFYEIEDKISIKHYPINIDSLREYILHSDVSIDKKLDSLGRLHDILNYYQEK